MTLNNTKTLPIAINFYNKGRQDSYKLKNFYLLAIQRESWRFFLLKGIKLAFEEFKYINFQKKNYQYYFEIIFQPKYLYLKKFKQEDIRNYKTFSYFLYIPVLINQVKVNENQISLFKWIYLGNLPFLSPNTSFFLDGISRTIITQIKKSPGLIISFDKKDINLLPYIKVLSPRGCWYIITSDINNNILISIRGLSYKIPIFMFFGALGLSLSKILNIIKSSILNTYKYNLTNYINYTKKYNSIIESRKKIYSFYSGINKIINEKSGNNNLEKLSNSFFFTNIWNSTTRYCGENARYHFFTKLCSPIPLNQEFLQEIDFIYLFKEFLIQLGSSQFNEKQVDHLKNKKFRSCGDYIYLQTRQALHDFDFLMQKILHSTFKEILYIKRKNLLAQENEKLKVVKFITFLDNDLVFTRLDFLKKILMKSWKSFFLSGTLSQFAENLNPLSFITHSRRFTNLGPGSLNLSQASVQVRSIDSSYNGRICPIETPEGINAGLVHSFGLFSHKEITGDLSLPFNLLYKGISQDLTITPFYFNVIEEDCFSIMLSDIIYEKWNSFSKQNFSIKNQFRIESNFLNFISFQNFSPYHTISLITGLIPFIEHNDANRALMGSNMQRQAMPVLESDNFLVSTGLDTKLFSDIGNIPLSPGTGFNFDINNNHLYFYNLKNIKKISFNFLKKTNHNSLLTACIEKKKNRWVEKGDLFINDNVTKKGKIALGPNLLVAYLPWYGYNYEDAIVLNENCINYKKLSSLNYETIICSLNLFYRKINKKKEFFYEVPIKFEKLIAFFFPTYYKLKYYNIYDINELSINTSKLKQPTFFAINNLRVGNYIKENDCIFSKCQIRLSLTRSLELQYNDLFLLLEETFPTFEDFEGFIQILDYSNLKKKKNKNYKDSIKLNTLHLKKNYYNKIINYYNIEDSSIYIEKKQEGFIFSKELKKNKITFTSITPFQLEEDFVYNNLESTEFDKKFNCKDIFYLETLIHTNKKIFNNNSSSTKWNKKNEERFNSNFYKKLYYKNFFTENTVIQILQLRNIQLGDKCAGRHGNKGIVSKICSFMEMPHLIDGTSVDIVLNPLGIPSRMNVGQILETLLGLAGIYLKESYIINIFDEQFGIEASRNFVLFKLYETSIKTGISWLFIPNHPGKTLLIDGVTGLFFQQPVTIGYSSILKLVHMIDDKMHSRSIGGYSTLTLQPTRGKSLLGGQRIGEMELWALQAYGAAWVIQELFTFKSDSLEARELLKKNVDNILENYNNSSNLFLFNKNLNKLKKLRLNFKFLENLGPYQYLDLLLDYKAATITDNFILKEFYYNFEKNKSFNKNLLNFFVEKKVVSNLAVTSFTEYINKYISLEQNYNKNNLSILAKKILLLEKNIFIIKSFTLEEIENLLIFEKNQEPFTLKSFFQKLNALCISTDI